MDADGDGVRRVSFTPGIETMPAISPDGKWVVYVTNRTGRGMKLWLQSLEDPDDEGRLLEPERAELTGLDMHPRFSPDGRWIVFTSDRAGFMDEWPLSGMFPAALRGAVRDPRRRQPSGAPPHARQMGGRARLLGRPGGSWRHRGWGRRSGGGRAGQQPGGAVMRSPARASNVAAAVTALAGTFAVPAGAQDSTAFHELAPELAGAYALEAERHLVIVPHPSLGLLSLFDLETGLARPLEPVGAAGGGADSTLTYVYGPNVTAVSPIEGRITFVRGDEGAVDRLLWRPDAGGEQHRVARRVPLRREPVRFTNGDEAELAGWLITPPSDGPHPVAVILQPGTNDRFGMWRTAMALAVDGIGVLVFDRRDAGASTGEELPPHYWSAAQVLAGDGAAAVRFARSHPRVDSTRVGVVGWSGGGWLGALVARRAPELAFYVNIAGNSNPGWQQNRWNRLSTLRWEGFDSAAVDEAATFLDDHYFALMHGETAWPRYEAAVRELEGRPWFDWMRETFGLWESEADARAYAKLERDNVPEEDFARVSAPTLGLFFEHDESSPPESPSIFLRGRARGPNPDVSVRVFPNTTHGAFVAKELPTEAGQSGITRLEPELFRELRRWVGDVVGDRADDREPWTPELAEELRAMGTRDQEVRQGIGPEMVTDTAFMGRMVRADSAHSRRLRGLIDEHGWPTAAAVGFEAAEAAFLIVQHTPFEDWQRSMLPRVGQAVDAGELEGQDYALLYDRVQMKLGHPQRYGTQLNSTDGGALRLYSLENPAAVDSLRAELGMPPLEEYLEMVEEAYGMHVER